MPRRVALLLALLACLLTLTRAYFIAPGVVSEAGAATDEPEAETETADDAHALERRQTGTCVYNAAAKRRLCERNNVPSDTTDIGSPNGQFAFIMSNGRPRIIKAGTANPLWNSSQFIQQPNGCPAFIARFTPEFNYRCLSQLWGTVRVQNGWHRPTHYTISNTGVVRFLKTGRVEPVMVIYPDRRGPQPATAYNVIRYIIRTTSIKPTSTRTTRTSTTKYRTVTELPSRDPLLHPFAHYSIWNLPLGDQAQLVRIWGPVDVPSSQIMRRPRAWSEDVERLFLNPNAPLTNIYQNNDGWTGRNRCSIASPTPLTKLPVPSNFRGRKPSSTYQPNTSSAFLAADNLTIIQGQPVTRCVDGGAITMGALYKATNVSILGGGRGGAHGGSGLSAIGGTLRAHEFRPSTYPDFPRHALKTFINARRYYYKGDSPSYRWPAFQAESFSDRQGTNPYLKSGSLLALPLSFNPEVRLRTNPGKMLANTLKSYGMYVDDDSHSDTTGINVGSEWGISPSIPQTPSSKYVSAGEPLAPRDPMAMFYTEFGIWGGSWVTNKNCTTFSTIYHPFNRYFCMDILDIVENMHVVVNWDARQYWELVTDEANYNTKGVGGGKPVSPWAAKLPEDPWLQPCLTRGRNTCSGRGLTESSEKGSPWQECLFETQLVCYSQ